MPNFPYPTYIEIVRALSKCFGVKNSNKTLDDKAFDKSADFCQVSELIEEAFLPISKYLGQDLATRIKSYITDFFDEYNSIISNIYADGISRKKMLDILSSSTFSKNILSSYTKELSLVSGPNPILFFSFDNSCIPQVLKWIEDKEPGWSKFVERLDKVNRDKVKSWENEDHIPSIQSIGLIQSWSNGPLPEQINWVRVRVLLWLASVMDRSNREYDIANLIETCRLSSWGVNSDSDVGKNIYKTQKLFKLEASKILPKISVVQQGLKRTVSKDTNAQEHFRDILNELRAAIYNDEKGYHITYWIDWHEARWAVFSGDLVKAVELYKSAFDSCLFRAGINQKFIIEEALVVASCAKSPDRVFLKKLKSALLTFKYDIPSINKTKSSNKFSDFIEQWEIENWRAGFKLVFPDIGAFPNTSREVPEAKVGPILSMGNEDITPDYDNVNKKVKVGETWKKTWPQLAWFIYQEDKAVVSKLLDEGASVNVSSSSGDTPLIMSLECMDVLATPYASLDVSFFHKVSKVIHNKDIVNQTTQKKKLLAIISAVQSGRLDIVRKVIEMGADVDKRGMTDNQTALNVCIKLIGMIKDPSKYWKEQLSMEVTPEVLDSYRRHTAGISGFSLNHQASALGKQNGDPIFQQAMNSIINLQKERVEKYYGIEELREISEYLIDVSADVNSEHSSPIKGYTPMMLAAELDEVDIFKTMLVKQGNPRKTYFCKNTHKFVDCWDIAEYFDSKLVLALLNDIKFAFPKELNTAGFH
ncbi:ankyrin repeat domain-containing protein [Colwellia sp. MB02u-10]|uniref:ankyrin repeat domain-containing protein n=1 Tax=Colwellia sp. MB02u-10 TaxID=2759828 RepID=UPI0015F61790|nr:ankyrin repeat domain-containing protein [Colwellia sp. MB02u-10]MBA6339602.1 ankyrin repeat domain-containing protein [Colwellia sp. MB02u-10]